MNTTPNASISEIARDTYRISVPMPPDFIPGGFSFNQYLIVDERPAAVPHRPSKAVRPRARADREGVAGLAVALHRVLACRGRRVRQPARLPRGGAAGTAGVQRRCGDGFGARSRRRRADRHGGRRKHSTSAATGSCGSRRRTCRMAGNAATCTTPPTKTLFCGDLFTQPGTGDRPLVSDDILAASEAFRHQMDYYAHSPPRRRADRQACATAARGARVHARQRVGRRRRRACCVSSAHR